MAKFPSELWLDEFEAFLNSDEEYARVASNWEADMNFVVEPGSGLREEVFIYLDLWHGKCREAYFVKDTSQQKDAAFTLQGSYPNVVRILKGQMDPMQAMLTRKLKVKGNMSYLLKNVPVVLNFVRCLQAVTDDYV